jgi:uncharacterized membrane protein YcaP (DUF421 family)
MQPEQIQAFDIKRLLIGNAPALFLLEVAVRAVFTYLVLLLATRALGKRVAGQMSVLELTVIVTLGAAIGVPLESPEHGLLAALIVLAIAVSYQRLIGHTTFRHRRAVALLEGAPSVLVRDGIVDVGALKHLSMSRERLFAMLRQAKILQMCQVKRAYLEANGQLSIFMDDQAPSGLSLLPGEDQVKYREQFADPNAHACRSCGFVEREERPEAACPNCHSDQWELAVRTVDIRELAN